ncbi:MAG: geranylfarnesyl diphosphate synthase [Halobacteriales archaeon]
MTSAEQRATEAIEARREVIDEAIPEELPIRRPERLYEASRYLLDAGGKRLRPTMLFLAAESFTDVEPLSVPYREFPDRNGERIDMMAAGVSVEVIHLFTLIHDDIMDDDDLRRGVPAVHREYDTETAILAGDTLYSTAFEIMLETGAPAERSVRALDRLATTCTEICEGQALDVDFESRPDVTSDEYDEMIKLKTAVLYGASASLPVILLGAEEETVEALYRYGLDVGRAFQIQDDLLDLMASSDDMGKRRGSDLVEGKRTLITTHARSQGVNVDGLVDSGNPTDADIDDAVTALREAGSIEYARKRAHELIDQGKSRLEALPDNEASDRLGDIADFLIHREY